jgi:hypothetical protein
MLFNDPRFVRGADVAWHFEPITPYVLQWRRLPAMAAAVDEAYTGRILISC